MRSTAPFVAASLACVATLGLAACSDAGTPDSFGQTSAAVTTFPNDKAAFDFFRSKGLTAAQSAGIVGNLDVESGVDPNAEESGGGGRGIAQWLVGGRWDTTSGDNVADYASMQGLSPTSLTLQLEFIWYELTKFSDYGLAKLKASTSVSGATLAFESGFEGCGSCSSGTRESDAQNVYDAYSGDAVQDGGGSVTTPKNDGGTACTVTTTGLSGVCIDVDTCANLGNHTSTAGYCPGADDVQCCTANATTSGDDDGGTSPGTGTGTGTGTSTGDDDDSGTVTARGDGSAAKTTTSVDSVDGGCAVSGPSRSRSSERVDASWLVGLAMIALRLRKRRERGDRH